MTDEQMTRVEALAGELEDGCDLSGLRLYRWTSLGPELSFRPAARRAIYVLALRAALAEITTLRSQVAALEAERDEARRVVRDTLWMAGRYADRRRTYAVGLYNDAWSVAMAGGYAHDAPPAVDGDSEECRTLTEQVAALEAQAVSEADREQAVLAAHQAGLAAALAMSVAEDCHLHTARRLLKLTDQTDQEGQVS